MGSRVAVMRSGLVEQCDTPQALYDRPANLFVAAFIGSPAMNLYEAAVGADARSLRVGRQEIILPEAVAAARPALRATAAQKVIVGLRPEHLPAASPAAEAVLEGDVDLVEALGSELLVHFSIDLVRLASEAGVSIPTVRKLIRLGIVTITPQIDLPKFANDAPSVGGNEPDIALNEDQQKVFDELRRASSAAVFLSTSCWASPAAAKPKSISSASARSSSRESGRLCWSPRSH